MKRAVRLGLVIAALAVIGAAVVIGPILFAKVQDLRYRFQLAERRIESLGRMVAAPIIAHQKKQGDARFSASSGKSPFQSGVNWRQIGGSGIAGSWSGDCQFKVKAMAVHQGKLFVGLLGSVPRCSGVWAYDGKAWAQSLGQSLHDQWKNFRYVTVLYSLAGRLYAGVDSTVWFLEKGKWRLAKSNQQDFPWTAKSTAYSMAHRGKDLLVGFTGGAARIYRFSAGKWSEISDGMNSSTGRGVYEIFRHDGAIFAGTISNPGPAEVYRLNENRWEKVGGGGLKGSWIATGSNYLLSFASYQGQLIATLNRNPQVPGRFVSVWAFNGETWHPVGRRFAPVQWGQTDNFNTSFVFKNRLYVGSGGRPAGNASVWELQPGKAWRRVGGFGVFGSWSKNRDRLSGNRDATAEYPYRIIQWRGRLVVGFGDARNAAQVWIYGNANAGRAN